MRSTSGVIFGRQRPDQEPLLRFADRDDFGGIPSTATLTQIQIDVGAVAAADVISAEQPMMPPAPRSLNPTVSLRARSTGEDAIARAHQNILQKRVGNLHGALVRIFVGRVERYRRKRRAAESARIGGFPDQHDIPSSRALRRRRNG